MNKCCAGNITFKPAPILLGRTCSKMVCLNSCNNFCSPEFIHCTAACFTLPYLQSSNNLVNKQRKTKPRKIYHIHGCKLCLVKVRKSQDLLQLSDRANPTLARQLFNT